MAFVWLNKRTGKSEQKTFHQAFEKDKKKNLSPNSYPFLAKLHEMYAFFSEFGTHTTVSSVAVQYGQGTTDTDFVAEMKYVEHDPEIIAKFLNMLIHVFWLIENAFHDAFNDRLKLDYQLQEMRRRFGLDVEKVRAVLRNRFGTFT